MGCMQVYVPFGCKGLCLVPHVRQSLVGGGGDTGLVTWRDGVPSDLLRSLYHSHHCHDGRAEPQCLLQRAFQHC